MELFTLNFARKNTMSKIYEYAKIVNQRANKLTRLFWKPYEDFADGLVWEWENKCQFANEEEHMDHIEIYSKLQGSYDGFLDFKKHYKAWLNKQKIK